MALKSPSQQTLAAACVRLAVLLASPALLVSCATGSVTDHIPTAIGGLPEATPARPQSPGEYPAVNDVAPPRETVLTSEEQKKLEDELIAARARTAGASGKPAGSARNP